MNFLFKVKERCCYELLILIFFIAKKSRQQVTRDCLAPLGLQDKTIPNDHITASSSHAYGTGPQFARLQLEEGDGAWCAANLINPGAEDDYLQIQLLNSSFVKRIATQGRYGNGIGNEFTRNYMVNYSRDGVSWFRWSNHNGVYILKGNVDTSTIKLQTFNPAIAGVKYIRVIPLTTRRMPVCLRLELYGCEWKSGLVAYTIPTPDHPSSVFHMFSDDTYDGLRSSSYFSGGLGQLADGIKGSGNLEQTMSRYSTNATGYDYVGWTQGRGKKIIATFFFDQFRNVSSVRVFCNTNSAVGASVFKSATVQASLNDVSFKRVARHVVIMHSGFTARVIVISINYKVMSSMRIIFELGRGRLLISEIEIYNEILPQNVSKHYSFNFPRTEAPNDWMSTQSPTVEDVLDSPDGTTVVGVLVGVIFLLFIIMIVLCCRHHAIRKKLTSPSFAFPSGSNRSEEIITLSPCAPPTNPQPSGSIEKCSSPIYHEIDPYDTSSNDVYLEPISVKEKYSPPPYTPSSSGRNFTMTSHYAETNLTDGKFEIQGFQGVTGSNIYSAPRITSSPACTKQKGGRRLSHSNLHGSATDADIVSEEDTDFFHRFNLSSSDLPPEFPRKKLKFVEKLGQGQFGEVQLCLANQHLRYVSNQGGCDLPGNQFNNVLVAVKILEENATENAKECFFKEVRIMSQLLHPNIIRLLAVCTQDEPYAMITEYMEHGDLHQHLKDFEHDLLLPGNAATRKEILLDISVQIASGMGYLASLNFIHRDLAARNCMVGINNHIRIGDLGMSRNIYESDYYKINGKAILPIRWMAWECVLMGLFTSSSDVWSFGVTIWEVYSLCKYQPYANLSDQQVIENLHHIFRKTGNQVFLPRPRYIPGSLFNVIRKCWRTDAQDRPTFQQLHDYLQERQKSAKISPKPKRPQVKPPTPTHHI